MARADGRGGTDEEAGEKACCPLAQLVAGERAGRLEGRGRSARAPDGDLQAYCPALDTWDDTGSCLQSDEGAVRRERADEAGSAESAGSDELGSACTGVERVAERGGGPAQSREAAGHGSPHALSAEASCCVRQLEGVGRCHSTTAQAEASGVPMCTANAELGSCGGAEHVACAGDGAEAADADRGAGGAQDEARAAFCCFRDVGVEQEASDAEQGRPAQDGCALARQPDGAGVCKVAVVVC